MVTKYERLLNSPSILRRIQAYRPYPFTRISGAAINAIEVAAASLPRVEQRSVPALLKMLECLLCITGGKLGCDKHGKLRIGPVYEQLVGAISSAKFLLCSPVNAYTYIRAWNALISQLDKTSLAAVRDFHWPSSIETTKEILLLALNFERCVLISDEVFYWQSSQIETRFGGLVWIPIRGLGLRYGRRFADFIYAACRSYIYSNGKRFVEINFFIDFLVNLPSNYEADSFSDELRVAGFWKAFKRSFVEKYMGISNYRYVTSSWMLFLSFAKTKIDGKGFFAFTPYHLTPLPGAKVVEATAPIKMDVDIEVEQKLLVDVPLHVSDEQALEILFNELDIRIEKIRRWASESIKNIWGRYLRRVEAATKGDAEKPRVYNAKNFSKSQFANIAAKFEKNGFSPKNAKSLARPLGDIAFALGLPTTGALLPHMALLVMAHNELTPSLLDDFELYDKHGQMNGFVLSDTGYILQGFKLRRGSELAQITVHLAPDMVNVVTQVIALTQTLRDYMKKKGDDEWRKLFLTCGTGFAEPQGVKSIGLTSDKHRILDLKHSFVASGIVSPSEVALFVKRFSLRSLRATVAVVSYIKNPDAVAFAKKLGHAKFDPKLLSRYMPGPLYRFFQQRWIRLFQCAIIATAMRESELVLRSTGFDTVSELHEFFKNHALKLRPRSITNNVARSLFEQSSFDEEFNKNIEVVFAVSVESLGALISLERAVCEAERPVTATALYWANYCKRLVSHIESCDDNSADLHDILTNAKIFATECSLGESIYA